MGVGTNGDDVLVGGNGNELLDGLAGDDTASYATAGRGVVANLGSGVAAYIPRVMPLGDSITYGAPLASTSGGYRGPLWNHLTASNLPIDFVGSAANGKFEDIDHEGHGGWTINEIDGAVDGWLTAATPDVVLLIIGTNDTNVGSPTPADIAARLSNLIDDISARPDPPTIFIGPIPPMVAQPADRVALAQGYNALIPDLIAQKRAAGIDITFVPMGDLTAADMTAPPLDGGLHPNASGYQKIADHWYDALLTLGIDNGALGLTPRDTFASIEHLEGSPFKDVLTGDPGPNRLLGLAGHDILDGAAGADTMTGGVGNDTYAVDDGADQVVELSGEGTDTVRVGLPAYTLGANLENLAFTGTGAFAGTGNGLSNAMSGGSGDDVLDGGALKDTLVGAAGDDRLIGGGDADRLEGGPGDDVYSVNSSGDDVVETLAQSEGGGIDTVESGQSYTLGVNLENLALSGASNISGIGNDAANLITGNPRNNSLDGQGGDDTLNGGAGLDSLTGGAGADVFLSLSADLNGDRINDFAAEDRIVLKQNLATAANVKFETGGANGLVEIDADNNGSFETVLILQGRASGQLLVSSGSGFSNNVIQILDAGLSISAASAAKAEGNLGATDFTFTITRAGDLSNAMSVDWAVTGSGAAPGDAADFGGALPGGQASFAAGEGSKLIHVGVTGDTAIESDEGFTVTLSNPSDLTIISQATALGSIFNDDADQPAAPGTPDLTPASDTGISTTDNLTNDVTPTFSGTAAAGSAVRLLEGSKLLGQATADDGGTWTITSSVLSAGSHAVSAMATSPSGAVGPRSGLLTVVVDASPPSKASTPDLLAESDSGRSHSDNITNDATPSLRGGAQAGSRVTIFDGATIVGTGVADSSGKWSLTTTGLSDGVHSLAAEAADAAGNVAVRSSLLKLTVDTQASSPEIISATTPKLMGTAEPGALVFISEGMSQLGKVTATSSGTWTFSKSLSNAPHTITVTSEDKAGNGAAGPGQILLGSSVADSLTGGPGDDRIIGLGGSDTLAGGAGDDVFVFGSGFGADVVNGFAAGAAGGDSIELSKAMLGLSSGASAQTAFDAAMIKTHDIPGGTIINIDSQNTITLRGATKASLELGDFVFI
jgi:Ca2+-binding RTX toxin-like protein